MPRPSHSSRFYHPLYKQVSRTWWPAVSVKMWVKGLSKEGYPVGQEGTRCLLTSFHSCSFSTMITGNGIFGAQNSRLVRNVACTFGTDKYWISFVYHKLSFGIVHSTYPFHYKIKCICCK
jgi:hypothetical protein